jgi:hypothetical protein
MSIDLRQNETAGCRTKTVIRPKSQLGIVETVLSFDYGSKTIQISCSVSRKLIDTARWTTVGRYSSFSHSIGTKRVQGHCYSLVSRREIDLSRCLAQRSSAEVC